MDKRKKALLIGLTLGDGYLNPRSGVSLEIEHGENQKFYLEYKVNLISELLHCSKPNIYHNKIKNTYKISKGHRIFRIVHKWLYKNKIKHFSKFLLSRLTPEAIALWWMDDGSHGIEVNKTTGKIRSHSFHFYTFTDENDTQNIIDYFKENFDIKFYPIRKKMKDGSIKYYLKCRTKEGRKLSNLLRPFILPQFQYKIMRENE